MSRLFGTSGIRGIFGEDVTLDLALKLGMAVGTKLGKGSVAIGWDPRLSSIALEGAITAGLESTGIQVLRLGMIPTPVLAFAARELAADTGVMITASHNPPEYNGIKLWSSDSSAYTPKTEDEIEDIIKNESFKMTGWESVGSSKEADVLDSYTNKLLGSVELSEKHNIVLDCGHGAASVVSPNLLGRITSVHSLFSTPDGSFPARNPEPIPENLSALMKEVKEKKAVAGIAHDGDADRLAVIDDKGDFVDKDQLLALLAINELEGKKGTIVVPVDTSLLVEDIVKENGGKIKMTPIGDVYVAQEMKKSKAVFGGEPSGCFIFPDVHWCPDGILASLKVLELIEKKGKLSGQVAKLPRYHTLRKTIKCSKEEEQKIVEVLYDEVRSMDSENIIEIDGVRADFDDSWLLVRPSGTEPKIRVTAEARSEDKARALLDSIKPNH